MSTKALLEQPPSYDEEIVYDRNINNTNTNNLIRMFALIVIFVIFLLLCFTFWIVFVIPHDTSVYACNFTNQQNNFSEYILDCNVNNITKEMYTYDNPCGYGTCIYPFYEPCNNDNYLSMYKKYNCIRTSSILLGSLFFISFGSLFVICARYKKQLY